MGSWVVVALAGVLAGPPPTEAPPTDTAAVQAPGEGAPTEAAPPEDAPASPAEDVPPSEPAAPAEPVAPTEPTEPVPTEEARAEEPAEEPKVDTEADRSQRARLRGRVLTYGEREPVGGARLVFENANRPPVESADDGSFSVFLPPGEHKITIRSPGFEDLVSSVTLAPKQDLELEYRMDRALDGPRYRTVVSHEKEVAVSSTTLVEEELREVPGSRGDPLRVVSSLPGVGTLAGFLPYVVVRGAAPGNTGYYLDGTRVPILFHVAIGPSVIHPYFIDAVDFYPSGAPVRLGRYASGIIEGRTRAARRDRVHGDVELKLTDASALVEVPLNRTKDPDCTEDKKRKCRTGPARGALTLAGRYSYTAAILSLAQANAKIQYWDYQARFDHKIGRTLDYTAFAYGSFDNLGLKTQIDPETGETEVDDNGNPVEPPPILRFQFHRIDNRIRQRLRGGGSAVYAVVLGLDQTGVTTLGTNEWRVAPRMDFAVKAKENVGLHFGIDQEVQVFRLAEQLDDLDDIGGVEDLALLFSDRTVTASGAYFDVEVEKNNVQVRPGIRADLYIQSGFSPYLPNARGVTNAIGIDPRILIREKINDKWSLRQSAGVYHQPPSSPIPIPGIESFGFERGLQRNTQASFGYEWQVLPDRVRIEQEAYVGRLSNLQDYELGDSEFEVEELEDVISQVNGWTYGLETLIKLEPGQQMFGWIAYTLSRSVRDFPLGGTAPSNWDQRHIINGVLGYKLPRRWNLGGRVHYHTGRPWTAPTGSQSMVDALRLNRNNARLPAFFQLDLRVSKTWVWPDWQLQAVFDVANATYSREIFACTPDTGGGGNIIDVGGGGSTDPTDAMMENAAMQGIAGCTPQGFRYTIPSFGLRARW